jgi:hypothetical protein
VADKNDAGGASFHPEQNPDAFLGFDKPESWLAVFVQGHSAYDDPSTVASAHVWPGFPAGTCRSAHRTPPKQTGQLDRLGLKETREGAAIVVEKDEPQNCGHQAKGNPEKHQGAETQDVHEHWAQDGKGKWNKAIHEQKQSANELPKKITTV